MRKDGREIEGWKMLSQSKLRAELAAESSLARRQFEIHATRLELPLSAFTVAPQSRRFASTRIQL
jgi:hypothetical protein